MLIDTTQGVEILFGSVQRVIHLEFSPVVELL